MKQSIDETTALSRAELHRLAMLERRLGADPVLAAVAGLFAQPPRARPDWLRRARAARPRRIGRGGRLAILLMCVVAVMTVAACAVALHLLAPVVAALLIVASGATVAAWAAKVFLRPNRPDAVTKVGR